MPPSQPDTNAPKEETRDKKRKVFVFFLTDGNDTCNAPPTISLRKEQLQAAIAKYGEAVVVNVLGFANDHNDAFLESLSLIGTSDGSYNFIAESDGDSALDERLTTLISSTTDLIGKSVYLDLTLRSAQGGGFLGDWFGQVKDNIVLQAFMHVNGGGEARVKSAKFVRVPRQEDFNLTMTMMRDIHGGAEKTDVPCDIGQVVKIEGCNDKLRLLKLRTGLNMMTVQMANLADDNVSMDSSAMKEVKEWFRVINHFASKQLDLKSILSSPELPLRRLGEAVYAGVNQIESTLHPSKYEPATVQQKRMRGGQSSWNFKSGQSHNVMQMKKKSAMRQDRAQQQQKQMCNDFY